MDDRSRAGVGVSSGGPSDGVELSVVIPCLNEADTVGTCVRKACQAMAQADIEGEVIVADNGSTDGSQRLAEAAGARVVPALERGYGHALMAGIAAARGRFVLMGDADDSYDFLEIPTFVASLRRGHDLVQGCRLPAGGGTVRPGAMPFSHRWIGNPLFTWLARRWFKAPIHDIYCGMRAFSRTWYEALHLRCTGMEFATEMIVKASLWGARIAEVPITLHPDGRRAHRPHLRTLRDGWRTLRFLLMYTPRVLFFLPGTMLVLAGLVGYTLALPGVTLWGATLDAHTLLVASLAILSGYQAILFAVWTHIFATKERWVPPGSGTDLLFRFLNLERGLIIAAVSTLVGLSLIASVAWMWWSQGFGDLDYARTMRRVVPGFTLSALGVQTAFGSFFASILGLDRR